MLCYTVGKEDVKEGQEEEEIEDAEDMMELGRRTTRAKKSSLDELERC